MTINSPQEVREVAEGLRAYAGHFADPKWEWNRHHGIKRIVYRPPSRPWRDGGKLRWFDDSELPAALWRAIKGVPGDLAPRRWRKRSVIEELLGRKRPLLMFRARLRRGNNLPDGTLGAGLFWWEEDGEYAQMVQPSVGLLVADMLDAHADSPAAQAVANEIERIQVDYGRRLQPRVHSLEDVAKEFGVDLDDQEGKS